jgi:hypothetical protein
VNLGNLTKQAKKLVDKRGGVEALKGDAGELKDIAGGGGSATAADALKEPGKHQPPA